jgi:hypothetical protein
MVNQEVLFISYYHAIVMASWFIQSAGFLSVLRKKINYASA